MTVSRQAGSLSIRKICAFFWLFWPGGLLGGFDSLGSQSGLLLVEPFFASSALCGKQAFLSPFLLDLLGGFGCQVSFLADPVCCCVHMRDELYVCIACVVNLFFWFCGGAGRV
jgi:hypothetical protein